jgi:flagellar motor switch protein FliM
MLAEFQTTDREDVSDVERNPSRACAPGHLASNPRELIERIHGDFLASLQPGLSDVLLAPAILEFRHSAQGPLSHLLDPSSPGCLAALDLTPVPGLAILRFTPSLLFRVLDTLLSAPPDAAATSREAITEIEIHILSEFFQVFADSLRAAWAPFLSMGFALMAAGTENVRKIASPSAGDATVIVTSRLCIGDSGEAFEIAIPGFAARLAEINTREAAMRAGRTESADPNLIAALHRSQLRVETVLRGSSIQMKDLLAMRQGQIFLLKTPLEASFDCLVNGRPHFTGHMIANGNRHGFQIASDSPGIAGPSTRP